MRGMLKIRHDIVLHLQRNYTLKYRSMYGTEPKPVAQIRNFNVWVASRMNVSSQG